jgi:hypothetical protein
LANHADEWFWNLPVPRHWSASLESDILEDTMTVSFAREDTTVSLKMTNQFAALHAVGVVTCSVTF